MWKLKNIETGKTLECTVTPEFVQGIWECGAFRITDATGTAYEVVPPAAAAPNVSPVEFKLLFTSSERVAINAILAAKTDPVLSDFYSILDDPRLTSVDMALESNQNAVGYALTVAGAAQTPPYTGEVIVARRSEILSGVLK